MTDTYEVLANRAILRVSGEEAEHFLENLVTCKIDGLKNGDLRFGALLTPQGKILFDFFVAAMPDGFLLDTAVDLADNLEKRLNFYKLRAKVSIERAENISVAVLFEGSADSTDFVAQDPRHPELGMRAYGRFSETVANERYLAKRIALAIPEGGLDFQYGDAYPHEVLMDQFAGVDFKKGCYVGQEVVSRMQHKTTVRKRLVHISSETELPKIGSEIMADGKPAGLVGSKLGGDGLAIVRLDRVVKANEILAGGAPVTLALPEWVNFSWPEIR